MSTKAPLKIKNNNTQIIAANPEQSVWVSANAGTGKTHVLINRILRLLLSGTPPHKILCLTFTKAAAAEVANRLRKRLGEWAAMNDMDLEQSLENILGSLASDKETAAARTLFASILEIPEGLRIRTVHSFAESLLGRFPVEAGLAPHFSVIDDRRATEIRAEARNQIICHDDQHQTVQLTEALSHIACHVNADDLENLLKELYRQRSLLRHLMKQPDGLRRMDSRTRKAFGLSIKDTKESLIKDASSNDKCINEKALYYAVKALQNGSNPDQDRAGKIDAWLNMKPVQREAQFEKTYAHIFLTKKYELRKESTLITKKPKEEYPEALSALLNERDRVFLVFERLKAVAIAEATKSLLIFGTALISAYEDIKASRALLDYDDLIEKAEGLLENESGVSWVHYKLDGGIDHILVDEAQDTSPAQWNIISRLAGDFFTGLGAENNERPQHRTVFAVGDEKQSIYSFQGAEPIRFGMMRNHFHEQETSIGRNLPTVELEASFRTTSAVLEVVDAVFASPEAFDGLTWNNKTVHHSTNRQGQAGLVELWDTLTTDNVTEIRPWDLPFDKKTAESPVVRLAEKIAKCIQDWLNNGECLQSTGRPITPGDIMILVPQRKLFAEEMLRALKRHGVPVIGRDRLILTDHLAAMDLIAAGRFALLPDDDLNTAVVLKGPFIEFDEDILFTLAHKRSETLWKTLADRRNENPEFARAWRILSSLLKRADYTPPFEFYSQLLNSGGRRDLLAHLGSEASEPIDEFIALTLDFERDHEPSLEGFLYWLERGKTEVKREMESGIDEVRVLTVHSAKGLESNIVFLPDTCKLPGSRKDPKTHWSNSEDDDDFVIWRTSKEVEEKLSSELHEASRIAIKQENRRLLYVAMTRARERLYVCGWEGKNGRKAGCWYDLIFPIFKENGEKISLDTGENLFRIERPQIVVQNEDKVATKKLEIVHPLPRWALTPAPPEPQPIKPLAPSRPTEEDPPTMSPIKDGSANRFQRGLLVHRLLQNLPNIALKDREAKGNEFLKRPSLNLTSKARGEILRETLAVINHPDHADLFGPGSLAEVPITGVLGLNEASNVISGQIDRILVSNNTVTIIDYKTNRPPPEDETGVSKIYLRQMAAYRDLIKSVYPERSVQALLLWTVGPRIMSLSNQILDDHAS